MSEDDAAVTPARIEFDAAGLPHAPEFGDVYHSDVGGPAQARHVFLGGNGLPMRWHRLPRFAILETGFGLGLNFLCTARTFLDDSQGPHRLHYVAVEKHPAQADDLQRAHAAWPDFAELAAELRGMWPPALRGFHQLSLGDDRITLTLLFGDVVTMLRELDSDCIDALFLDGFAPAKNPRMWSPEVFAQIARVSRPDATAATWSIASVVRSGLQSAGFAIERQPGFGRKRDMLCARRTANPKTLSTVHRKAIVIGAGLAGCWTAHALVRQGWTVDLLERHAAPAMEASGNPVGALLPALNLADNLNARLGRAAFLHASRVMTTLSSRPPVFERRGLLHLALERESVLSTARGRDRGAQRERMQEILRRHRFPSDYVQWVNESEASDRAGMRVGADGWWIPAGGWVQPTSLCHALLARCGSTLRVQYDTHARRLERTHTGWQVIDDDGHCVVEAPVVVIAGAHEATMLVPRGLPRLICVRGQITYLPRGQGDDELRCAICGDGYVAPLSDGGLCVGATFEPGSQALDLRDEDHAQNLRRAARMLPDAVGRHDPASLRGRVGLRTATADRLPACGEITVPDWSHDSAPGPHAVVGLGARGLIWAPLCAEILASRLTGEPNPVEASLIAAMRPERDTPTR